MVKYRERSPHPLITWRVVGDTRLTAFALNYLSAACLALGA